MKKNPFSPLIRNSFWILILCASLANVVQMFFLLSGTYWWLWNYMNGLDSFDERGKTNIHALVESLTFLFFLPLTALVRFLTRDFEIELTLEVRSMMWTFRAVCFFSLIFGLFSGWSNAGSSPHGLVGWICSTCSLFMILPILEYLWPLLHIRMLNKSHSAALKASTSEDHFWLILSMIICGAYMSGIMRYCTMERNSEAEGDAENLIKQVLWMMVINCCIRFTWDYVYWHTETDVMEYVEYKRHFHEMLNPNLALVRGDEFYEHYKQTYLKLWNKLINDPNASVVDSKDQYEDFEENCETLWELTQRLRRIKEA